MEEKPEIDKTQKITFLFISLDDENILEKQAIVLEAWIFSIDVNNLSFISSFHFFHFFFF